MMLMTVAADEADELAHVEATVIEYMYVRILSTFVLISSGRAFIQHGLSPRTLTSFDKCPIGK